MTKNFERRVIEEQYVATRNYVYRCIDGETIERTTEKPQGLYFNLSWLHGWEIVK